MRLFFLHRDLPDQIMVLLRLNHIGYFRRDTGIQEFERNDHMKNEVLFCQILDELFLFSVIVETSDRIQ